MKKTQSSYFFLLFQFMQKESLFDKQYTLDGNAGHHREKAYLSV